MRKRIQNAECRMQNLMIEVDNGVAVVRCRGCRARVELKNQSLLWGIAKLVQDPPMIKGIEVRITKATFSATRQVVAVVNTLAWQLGVHVNGKKQIRAEYSGAPNITMLCRDDCI